MPALIRSIAPIRTHARPWSWAELVAETAGLGELEALEVSVRCRSGVPTGWRLVVQEVLIDDPQRGAIASAQRSISDDTLRAGLTIKVYRQPPSERTEVIAWLEPGTANLEYDGLRAEASQAAWLGRAKAHGSTARLQLHPVTTIAHGVVEAA